MAAVLPFLQAASAAVGLAQALKKPKTPQAPPPIGYDEALVQARARLDPLFKQEVDQTLENLNRSQIARGFYGQMPADAFTSNQIGQLRTNQAGQIANLASAIEGQSKEYALQAAAQAAAEQQNRIANLMGIAGTFGGMVNDNYLRTGEAPGFWPWGQPAQQSAQPVQLTEQPTGFTWSTQDNTPPAPSPYRPYLSEW